MHSVDPDYSELFRIQLQLNDWTQLNSTTFRTPAKDLASDMRELMTCAKAISKEVGSAICFGEGRRTPIQLFLEVSLNRDLVELFLVGLAQNRQKTTIDIETVASNIISEAADATNEVTRKLEAGERIKLISAEDSRAGQDNTYPISSPHALPLAQNFLSKKRTRPVELHLANGEQETLTDSRPISYVDETPAAQINCNCIVDGVIDSQAIARIVGPDNQISAERAVSIDPDLRDALLRAQTQRRIVYAELQRVDTDASGLKIADDRTVRYLMTSATIGGEVPNQLGLGFASA